MTSKQNSDESETEQQLNKHDIPRRSVLTALGIGGVGLLSGAAQASGSSQNPIYNWQQDVDANGHGLSELDSVSMAASSKAITDFAGANLSVNNGVLNADTGSGIAKSGEKILLTTVDLLGDPMSFVNQDWHGVDSFRRVPFDKLSTSNIEQLYVSITGVGRWWEGSAPTYIRLYDESSDSPVEGTEVKIDHPDDSVFTFESPQVAYGHDKTVIFELQAKAGDGNADESILNVAINIWGEIA